MAPGRWSKWRRKVKWMGAEGAPQLLFEKILSSLDANRGAGRLVLPGTRKDIFGREPTPITLSEFLTDSEKEIAGGEGEGLRVILLDKKGRWYRGALLRRWGNNSSYALEGSWFDLVAVNQLRPHDKVDVFVFRAGGRVGMAVCGTARAHPLR
ncbi:putative B3 domain-containing protein At3g49610 [Wolffia australiana]